MKKFLLFALTLCALVCVFAFTVSAAETNKWFGEVEYLEGINVSDHIKTPVTEETPELGEPTTAARVKVSCTCAAGSHTFPAYYVAQKDNNNSEMWYFNFKDVNAKLTCGGEEMGTKNLIAYEFPNGISGLGCTLYYDCPDMNLKVLSFERAQSLTSMSGTWAGKNWFAGAPIEEVRFGPYLKNVASFLFYNCQSLAIADFGESSQITAIGDYAFYRNKALTEMLLPDTITSLGNCAFKECSSLGAFYLPASLTQLGNSTSSNASPIDTCPNLYFINDKNDTSKPTVYYIPEGITAIIGEAFKGCTNLNDVLVFHKGITAVSSGWAFCNSNAVSIVFLGDMTDVATASNQAWNNKITIYFCNENDLSKDNVNTNAKCSLVFCYADGNESHIKELSKSTEATCELPKMNADFCFCGQFIPGTEVTDGIPLGHSYTGAVTYTFTSVTENGQKCTVCTNNCGKDLIEAVAPVYTELGYSANTFDTDKFSITNGYKIDTESLKLYEKTKGVTLKLGFGFNAAESFTDGEVTVDSFKLKAEVANQDKGISFSYHDFVISYTDDRYLDSNIIVGVYVIETSGDTQSAYFINRNYEDGVNGFESVSYNSLVK